MSRMGIASRLVPDRRRAAGERGTTLFEVTLTMALSVAVLGAVLGVFDSFTMAERSHRSTLDARDDARQGIAEITRDLRATTSFLAPPNGVSATDALVLTLSDGRVVRWWQPVVSGPLIRDVLASPDGPVESSRSVVEEPGDTALVVQYYLASADEVPPDLVKSSEALDCVTRVSVEVAAAGDTSDAAATRVSADVAPRSLESRGLTC